jgi:hypothetical protein
MNNEEPHDDRETGEVPREGEIVEGEVLSRDVAADGGPAAFAAGNLGDLLNQAEDGQFGADVMVEMRGLIRKMVEMAEASGNKQKGRLTINLDFRTEGDAFFVIGSHKITPPKETRRQTIMWPNEKGNLGRSQPNQRQLFGIRQVGGTAGAPRRV